MSEPIYGRLVRAGNLLFEGDAVSTSGLLVEIPREDLRAVPTLPMYQRVVVVPADEYEAMRNRSDPWLAAENARLKKMIARTAEIIASAP